MAYVRDDVMLSQYRALQARLADVQDAIERRSSAGIAVDAELPALKRSIEQRLAELKENCHLLQR